MEIIQLLKEQFFICFLNLVPTSAIILIALKNSERGNSSRLLVYLTDFKFNAALHSDETAR